MLGEGSGVVLVAGHAEWEDSGLDVLEWGVIGGEAEPAGTGGATLGRDLQARV